MTVLGLTGFFQALNSQFLIHTNCDLGFSPVSYPAVHIVYTGGDGSQLAAALLSTVPTGFSASNI